MSRAVKRHRFFILFYLKTVLRNEANIHRYRHKVWNQHHSDCFLVKSFGVILFLFTAYLKLLI